jgi:hypothetical protein
LLLGVKIQLLIALIDGDLITLRTIEFLEAIQQMLSIISEMLGLDGMTVLQYGTELPGPVVHNRREF